VRASAVWTLVVPRGHGRLAAEDETDDDDCSKDSPIHRATSVSRSENGLAKEFATDTTAPAIPF